MKKIIALLVVACGVCCAQQFRTSTMDPSGSCTTDVVYNTQNQKLWGCDETGAFVVVADGGTTPVSSVSGTANEITVTGTTTPTLSIASAFDLTGKTSTAPIKSGTSLPATCSVGQFYDKTDATAGSNLYSCTATDTWTAIGGGGGGTPGGMDTAVQFNDSAAFGGDSTNFSWDKTTKTLNIGSDSATGVLNVNEINDGSCCLNMFSVGPKDLTDYLKGLAFPAGIQTTITADLYDAIIATITGGAEGCMNAGCIATYWTNWGYNSMAATPGHMFAQLFFEYEFRDDGTKYLSDYGMTRCNSANIVCNNGGDEANWFYAENGHAAGFASLPMEGVFHVNALQTNVQTVAALETCNSDHKGARQFVTDSNAVSFTAGIGAVVAAGGSTNVPVVCDGTNWRIG